MKIYNEEILKVCSKITIHNIYIFIKIYTHIECCIFQKKRKNIADSGEESDFEITHSEELKKARGE